MYRRGLVLIGFSGMCLAAAGLTYQAERRQSIAHGLAEASHTLRTCMREGITTSGGRVGCFRPVSAVLSAPFGGGGAITRR